MRIVLVSALLLATASCAWAPPRAAVPPPAERVATATPVLRPTPLVPEPAAPAPILAPVPLHSAAPPPGIVLAPAPPRPVVALEPTPLPARPVAVVAAPPVAPAGPLPPVFVPRWLSWLYGRPAPASPGRMTLSNFSFDLAEVQALVTPYPDCVQRPGMTPVDMKLPLNGTFVVNAPPGSDVCWRSREEPAELGVAPITGPAAPPSEWSPWNRVFTSFGHSVSAGL